MEELGFASAIGLLAVFIFLLFNLIRVAKNAEKPFTQFIVFGIAALIMVQMFINIGAAVGSIPFTGIALPFISYGGTSLVVFMSAMGIAVRAAKEEKT